MASTPVVVIGGYLGAGKTTLVNHLLRHAGGRRVLVMVNDFGSISIDAELIEGASDGVLALAGGCACCSFGADLVGTLQQALARTPPPEVVLVECSGVGLPAAVARSVALAPGAQVQGVALVVDAAEAPRQARDAYMGDTVRQQWRDADLLIVNQADRANAAELQAVAQALAAAAPGTPQLVCSQARVPPELVFGLQASADAAGRAWAEGSGRYAAAGGVPAAQRLRFFDRRIAGATDVHALAAELAAPAGGLLRAKGVVRGLDGALWLVQVMGRRYEIAPAPPLAAADVGRVACIALAAVVDG
ncbi:MAG: GTP-binding protein [Proteobacteria bacterium]|nr:GTP-binding protein [Pseudomonadota bacterium]